MIKRQQEGRIIELLKHFPSIAILGPRQAGKTTLAKQIINRIKKDSVYLDLEISGDVHRLSDPENYFEQNRDKCIVIDEIQRKPELFPILRGMIDRHKKAGRFILLGSASPDWLKKSSETLAGRISYLELTPLNFLEINQKFTLNHHWFRGGFPTPVTTRNEKIPEEWFRSFIRTYIERDLPLLGMPSPPPPLVSRLISMVAHHHGQIWNASSFAKSLGISSPTVSNYFDFLDYAYLVRRLQPFFSNGKKRIVKSPKIYLRDSGLLHHLINMHSYEQLLGHPIIGFSWEGYVIEQIISVSQNKFEYYFYRTQDQTECDLIIARGNIPLASIEIKFGIPEKTKSFTTAIQDLKTTKNYIIIPKSSETYPLDRHITVCGLSQFITKILPTIR